MGNAPQHPSETVEAELRSNLNRNCSLAAEAIAEADIFLLCTGAGFSADSGLAIYADVAKVEAYATRNLTYYDICQPRWLQKEPELFWGFWGQCFNDYRDTAPHEGYEIINKWVDRKFRTSEIAQTIRRLTADQEIAVSDSGGYGEERCTEPYHVKDQAGAFFVFTSNVDAHHFDWFRACEIRECHGNTELYQCGHPSRKGCKSIWRAPRDYRFRVDKDTMLTKDSSIGVEEIQEVPEERSDSVVCVDKDTILAKDSSIEAEKIQEVPGETPDNVVAPRIGHVKGGGRESMLRYMPGSFSGHAESSFAGGHPTCKLCGSSARPAILMFGDGEWLDVESQEARWRRWSKAVSSYIQTDTEKARQASSNKRIKVAILEIGAGGNVTTVRSTSENTMRQFREAGAEARLVRINPDLPLRDDDELMPNEIISVMSRGLESIRMIDAAMPAASGSI